MFCRPVTKPGWYRYPFEKFQVFRKKDAKSIFLLADTQNVQIRKHTSICTEDLQPWSLTPISSSEDQAMLLLCISSKAPSSRLQLDKEREFPFCGTLSSSWNMKCKFGISNIFSAREKLKHETEQLTALVLDHLRSTTTLACLRIRVKLGTWVDPRLPKDGHPWQVPRQSLALLPHPAEGRQAGTSRCSPQLHSGFECALSLSSRYILWLLRYFRFSG